MVVATSYPFLDVVWSMLVFFAFFVWIWMAVTVFMDLVRRRDTSGFAKVLWIVAIIVLPFLGVLVYLVANHDGMAQRQAKDVERAQAQFDEYVRQAVGSGSTSTPAAEVERAKALLDSGAITPDEFAKLKAKAVG